MKITISPNKEDWKEYPYFQWRWGLTKPYHLLIKLALDLGFEVLIDVKDGNGGYLNVSKEKIEGETNPTLELAGTK